MTKHSSQNKQLQAHLVRFSDREELWIKRAIALSKQFMENYGKGRQPYEIDLSHYETERKTSFGNTPCGS